MPEEWEVGTVRSIEHQLLNDLQEARLAPRQLCPHRSDALVGCQPLPQKEWQICRQASGCARVIEKDHEKLLRAASASSRKRAKVARGYVRTCRAMNALTISRARSVCGPGSATHSCGEPSNKW